MSLFGRDLSWRDLILIGGGLFLVWKATTEIHESLEGEPAHHAAPEAKTASFGGVLIQILLLDIVFSLDSVLTAVGMVDEVAIMIVAVVIAVGVMLVASGPLSRFVHDHPTVKMLALVVPAAHRRDADRRRVRVPHRQGVHLRRDGLQRLRRGTQPARAEAAPTAGRTTPDLREGRGRARSARPSPTSGGTHRLACISA